MRRNFTKLSFSTNASNSISNNKLSKTNCLTKKMKKFALGLFIFTQKQVPQKFIKISQVICHLKARGLGSNISKHLKIVINPGLTSIEEKCLSYTSIMKSMKNHTKLNQNSSVFKNLNKCQKVFSKFLINVLVCLPLLKLPGLEKMI